MVDRSCGQKSGSQDQGQHTLPLHDLQIVGCAYGLLMTSCLLSHISILLFPLLKGSTSTCISIFYRTFRSKHSGPIHEHVALHCKALLQSKHPSCRTSSLTSAQLPPNREAGAKIIGTLRRSPDGKGFGHLGLDGVYRAFDGNREVIDYKRLSPEEIDVVVRGLEGLIDDETSDKIMTMMEDVDGRNVTREEELLHPGPEVKPEMPKIEN